MTLRTLLTLSVASLAISGAALIDSISLFAAIAIIAAIAAIWRMSRG